MGTRYILSSSCKSHLIKKPGDPTVEWQPNMERLWATETWPLPRQWETSRPYTGEGSIQGHVTFTPFRAPRLDILPWASRPFQVYLRRLKITRTTVKGYWADSPNLDWPPVTKNLSIESLVWSPSGLSVTFCVFETMPKSWYYSCDTPSGKLICTAFIAIHSRYLIFKLINTQLI